MLLLLLASVGPGADAPAHRPGGLGSPPPVVAAAAAADNIPAASGGVVNSNLVQHITVVGRFASVGGVRDDERSSRARSPVPDYRRDDE